MRNCDIIKDLRHELGRYKDKVERQAAEIKQLKEKLAKHAVADRQLSYCLDEALAKTAVTYGTACHDEETGELLGYNLELPAKLERKYEVHTKVEGDHYLIGALEEHHDD